MRLKSYSFLIILFCTLIYSHVCSGKNGALASSTMTLLVECASDCFVREFDEYPKTLATEIAVELSKLANDNIEIKPMPWKRAFETLKSEPNAMIIGMSKTNSRKALFKWLGHITLEKYYFWRLKPKFETINTPFSLNAAKYMRIASYRASNENDFLRDNQFSHVYETVYPNQRIHMLFRERVELVVETENMIYSGINELGYSKDRIQKEQEIIALRNSLSIATNQETNPLLFKKYRQAFLDLKENGALDKILKYIFKHVKWWVYGIQG